MNDNDVVLENINNKINKLLIEHEKIKNLLIIHSEFIINHNNGSNKKNHYLIDYINLLIYVCVGIIVLLQFIN
jgi:hypothetical protein